MVEKMSFTTIFNIWRWSICRKLPSFASEDKPYRMKTIANIIAFASTYTVAAMVFLIIAQNLVKWLHHTSVLTLEQERTTVILCLIAAAALIPFFHYPY